MSIAHCMPFNRSKCLPNQIFELSYQNSFLQVWHLNRAKFRISLIVCHTAFMPIIFLTWTHCSLFFRLYFCPQCWSSHQSRLDLSRKDFNEMKRKEAQTLFLRGQVSCSLQTSVLLPEYILMTNRYMNTIEWILRTFFIFAEGSECIFKVCFHIRFLAFLLSHNCKLKLWELGLMMD